MNIFEDLIEELKEENLLEETVIETSTLESQNTYNQPLKNDHQSLAEEVPLALQANTFPETEITDFPEPELFLSKNSVMPEITEDNLPTFEEVQANLQFSNFQTEFPGHDSIEEPFEPLAFVKAAQKEQARPATEVDAQLVQNLVHLNDPETETIIEEEKLLAAEEFTLGNKGQKNASDFSLVHSSENPLLAKAALNDGGFFRRRATEEVNSLKIVEHIISALEREYLKTMPNPYDDLPVSMALHDFLKLTETPNSIEHAQAEFKLMQETESWYTAISQRDHQVPVESLRKYCENTRPALSAQALISLARFYRNSPFSEAVRCKFELVITRLLTKELPGDKREMLFTRDELIKQLENLYADWSSIPLYESKDDDSDVLIGVLKFEDFAVEITGANKFEELIKNDFFNRLKIYKESTGEKFFAPLLAATAVESNVVIGNKYVDLINLERERANSKLLGEKYSFLLDQTVSNATNKTLQLIELLREKNESDEDKIPNLAEVVVGEFGKAPVFKPKEIKKRKFSPLSIILVIVSLAFLGGVYYWSEYLTPEMKTSPSVKKVNLDSSSLKEYFKTARISKNTFFAVAESAWDRLSRDVKEDVLKKTLAVGSEKGYDKIHVLDKDGKTIAFASDLGVTIDPK
jgi:hypothetical protein